ncbi:hypothetical protein R6Q59_012075, partial [Mikania micrantha]
SSKSAPHTYSFNPVSSPAIALILIFIMLQTNNSPSIKDAKHLRIPLQEIRSATREFDHLNFIARGGYGRVYKGESEKYGKIAVKRWDSRFMQGEHEFTTEISLLSKCKHENIVSLLGFCDEDGEKILVYKYECNGSLDNYIKRSKDLTWIQRLQICLGVACGLNYLHSEVGSHQRFLHRDIKSSNILLDENLKPKISDFGLSRVVPVNMQSTFVISNPCGTPGYIDPDYFVHGYLTQKTDVYSFGVVLWEVLSGRLVNVTCKHEHVPLPTSARKHYYRNTLDKIIPPGLHKQINTASLLTFSNIAYQCLENVEVRPTMSQVVEQLRKALHDQLESCCIQPKDVRKAGEGQSKVVLKVTMHCEECAREVEQRLRNFKGVEDVHTDFRQKVELLAHKLVPESPMEEFMCLRLRKREKKKEEGLLRVVLKVHLHCEDCAQKIKKTVTKTEGVISAVHDINKSELVVTGSFDVEVLVDSVYKKTGEKVMIVSIEP